MRAKFLKNNSGYILVEALVASTIIVVGLLGIFSLLSQSLSLNKIVGERYIAVYLAMEGIEIVKNIIDNNVINDQPWNANLSSGTYEADYNDSSLEYLSNRPLYFNEQTGFYSYTGGEPTKFFRTIEIQQLGGGEEIKINSVVKWTTRGDAEFEVDLEDRFFNWR